MKGQIKKILAVLLALCLTVTPILTASAAQAPENEIMPLYNNTISTTSTMGIDSNGRLDIAYHVVGMQGITTKIVTTSYVEKKVLGLFWKRVDNGETDNQWVNTVNSYRYTASRTCQLNSTGTYRVTIQYKVYGSGGSADVIDYQGQDTY